MDTDPRAVELATEQADEWLERLKDPRPGESAEFMRWLKTSPLHVRELLRAAALDTALNDVDPNKEIDIRALLAHLDNVISAPVTMISGPLPDGRKAGAVASVKRFVGTAWETRSWRIAAVMALIALTAVAAVSIDHELSERLIATEASEWRTKLLSDGTQIKVGPRSNVRLEFGVRARHIYMSGGEVLFDVARDAQRPFIVHTRRAEVRALGTVFGVSDLGDRVLVTVEEGAVAVVRSGRPSAILEGAASTRVRVAAGQQVTVTEAQPLVVAAVDASVELAWADGRLVISGWTIGELAKEFNRRNLTQIEITDPRLAGRRIFGTFDAGDPHAFAATVLRSAGQGVVMTDRQRRIRLGFVPDAERRAPTHR